ncbi:MAG TPA: carbohydrate porin [Opitutae bacterium]|nr:carbohydrate porin [Puniceicoccaceae bacterium]HBR92540.1 carbohydrate porin [Opitutae bacterium]|tara:strand:+ start:999 stop:2228 length:1230 start_codon:yes stop_codon:yes gene_type:complete
MKIKTLTLSLLIAATGSAWAESEPYSDRLTGDWGGARTDLAEAGIEVFAYYNTITSSLVSGGIDDDTNFAGDLFAGVQFDLDKILGWDATTFTLTGIERHGSDVTPNVGSQYSVMQLVGGQNTFLYNVTLEKLFADGDIAVKLGRMTATDDFVGSSLYSYSLSNAVNGQIRAVLFDGVMTSYPFPVWGGRVKAKVSEDSSLQVGVFQLTKEMWDREKQGVDFSIDADDGVSLFVQYDWTPEINGKPARFFAGINQTFAFEMDEFNSTDTTDSFTRFYGHADYQVYRESADSDQGLTLFMTFAYTAQDEVAIVPIQSTFGAHYKGLLDSRPEDRTVFFMTYGGFSDEYSDELEAGLMSGVDYEMVFELGHRIQLTEYAYIQPDIQFIKNPGGTGDIDDAIVVGAQIGFSF